MRIGRKFPGIRRILKTKTGIRTYYLPLPEMLELAHMQVLKNNNYSCQEIPSSLLVSLP
jgi:hypothetical protein